MNYIKFYLGQEKSDTDFFIKDIWEKVSKECYIDKILIEELFPLEEKMEENDWKTFIKDFAIKRNMLRSILCILFCFKINVQHQYNGESVNLSKKEDFKELDKKTTDFLIDISERIKNYSFGNYSIAIMDFVSDNEETYLGNGSFI